MVDDDQFFRTFVRACLEDLGHKVVEASDGNHGLGQCAQWRPDLIMSDLLMPNKDGLDFIREVRRYQPNLKVIAMSIGYTQDDGECLDLALKAGAEAAICKPFSIDQLHRAIQAVMHLNDAASES